jgi:GTP cyclohydrolase I
MEKSLTLSDPAVYKAADLLDGDGIDTEKIQSSVFDMLTAFGENPDRDGLQRTPERVARMYEELLPGRPGE